MSIPKQPKRRDGVVLREIGAEAMLYDGAGDQVVRLNATSRRIWELCDGLHDVSGIAAIVRDEFQVAPDVDVVHDVQHTIGAFATAGLIQEVS